MISLRIGLLSAVLTLGLTACGHSIEPFTGFNSGASGQDYHGLLLGASAAGGETCDRNGRLVAISGPLIDREDMPREATSSPSAPIKLAARLDTLPIPALRPQLDSADIVEDVKISTQNTAVLVEPTDEAIASAALVKPEREVTPEPDLQDTPLLVPNSEIVLAPSLSFDAIAPSVTAVAFQPETSIEDARAGLALLNTSQKSTTLTPEPQAAENPTSGVSGVLDSLMSTTIPDDIPNEPQVGAPETGLEADILALNDEEMDILLVQLEDDKSGLERVRNMTPEEKARLRFQYEKRSFLGHFAKMDRGNDGALTRQEMLAYFTIMHAAFDADYDNVVTRAEAPTLLLRIKLLGRGFPKEGLTLEELTARLEETFVFLDRNKNDKLGWPELL